jgi:hypothetical protein
MRNAYGTVVGNPEGRYQCMLAAVRILNLTYVHLVQTPLLLRGSTVLEGPWPPHIWEAS